MAVLLQTSLGELTIDLYIDEVPLLAANFLKLSRAGESNEPFKEKEDVSILSILKKENPNEYQNIITGKCDDPLYCQPDCCPLTGQLYEKFHPRLRHNQRGVISMANHLPNQIGSFFFITLRDSIDYLDNKRSIIGYVSEGFPILDKFNATLVEDRLTNCPLQVIRILHTIILDDPFNDPPGLFKLISSISSPLPIQDDVTEHITEEGGIVEEEIAALERIAHSEAKSRAVALEILGDLPDAELSPPDNVLFICKLNPVTEATDLELIFSRFGKIISCDIIRDWKTGDSLQYGFIEYEDPKSCEAALFKMEGCLIDDRRIHVDFCQSVSKQWTAFRRFGSKQKTENQISLNDSQTSNNTSLGFLFDKSNNQHSNKQSSSSSNHRSHHHRVVPASEHLSATYSQQHHSSSRKRYKSTKDNAYHKKDIVSTRRRSPSRKMSYRRD